MRKVTILAAAAAIIGVSGIAHADGLYQKDTYKAAHVAAPSVNWTGLYIGAGIGGGAVVHNLDASASWRGDGERSRGEAASANLDGIGGEGVFGTVQVGYDRQVYNRWVLGVFFDYDFSGIESKLGVNYNSLSANITLNQDYMWTVGGRFGYLVQPATLVYALAGYSESEFTLDYGSGSWTMPTFSGLTLGGGIETQLSGNWFLKGEYRFTQFDREDLYSASNRREALNIGDEPSLHTARVVLTHKLDLLGHSSPLK